MHASRVRCGRHSARGIDVQDVAGEQGGVVSEGFGGVEHNSSSRGSDTADVEVSSARYPIGIPTCSKQHGLLDLYENSRFERKCRTCEVGDRSKGRQN